MKNLLVLLSFLLLGQLVTAQNNVIDLYFKAEQKNPDFSKLKVNSKTFEYVKELKSVDVQEQKLIASIQKLEGIKALFLENSDKVKLTYDHAYKQIMANNDYDELMSLRHEDHNGIFMIREADDKILELMAMFTSDQEFGVISIFGEIELQSILDLAQVMEKNGKAWFDHFENMSDDAIVLDKATSSGKKSSEQILLNNGLSVRIYPNPAVDHINIESLSDENEEFEISFYSLLGEQLKDLGKVQMPLRLEVRDFPIGAYFVRITSSDGTFMNYRIVKP